MKKIKLSSSNLSNTFAFSKRFASYLEEKGYLVEIDKRKRCFGTKYSYVQMIIRKKDDFYGTKIIGIVPQHQINQPTIEKGLYFYNRSEYNFFVPFEGRQATAKAIRDLISVDTWGIGKDKAPLVKSDAGRFSYKRFKKESGDCVVRALSHASGKSYLEVYKQMFDRAKAKKWKFGHPNTGLNKRIYERYLNFALGAEIVFDKKQNNIFRFTPSNIKKKGYFKGTYIIETCVFKNGRVKHSHLTCLKDGVLYDTYNASYHGGNPKNDIPFVTKIYKINESATTNNRAAVLSF